MSTIGITQPGLQSIPALSVPVQAVAAAGLPAAQPDLDNPVVIPQTIDIQGAERKRVETLQKAAQQIANVFVLGDQSFSLFKDATGQYITRFTSLRDGKVTYIPEPTLFKLSSSSQEPSVTFKV